MQNEKNRSQKQIWRFRSGLVVALFYFFILSVSHLLCPGPRCCTFWFILLRRNLMQGQFARRRRFLRRARACCWQKNNPANVIPDPFFPCQGGQPSSMSDPKFGGWASSCTWRAHFWIVTPAVPTTSLFFVHLRLCCARTYLATLAGMHAVMETGGLIPANAAQHCGAIEFCKEKMAICD